VKHQSTLTVLQVQLDSLRNVALRTFASIIVVKGHILNSQADYHETRLSYASLQVQASSVCTDVSDTLERTLQMQKAASIYCAEYNNVDFVETQLSYARSQQQAPSLLRTGKTLYERIAWIRLHAQATSYQ
jgi:hypothetical protein